MHVGNFLYKPHIRYSTFCISVAFFLFVVKEAQSEDKVYTHK